MKEHDNDESITESELKPEEMMPDAWSGGNDWVKDIEYEKILARLERFKEKTGLTDGQVEAILDGGNYKSPLDDEFLRDMKEEYGLDRDALLDEADRVAKLVLSNDKTIELIDKLEEQAGFTTEQIAKILKGSAEYTDAVLEIMTDDFKLHNFELIRGKGGLSIDDISDALEGIGKDFSKDGEIVVEDRIDDLYNKHVDLSLSEEEMEENFAQVIHSRDKGKAKVEQPHNPFKTSVVSLGSKKIAGYVIEDTAKIKELSGLSDDDIDTIVIAKFEKFLLTPEGKDFFIERNLATGNYKTVEENVEFEKSGALPILLDSLGLIKQAEEDIGFTQEQMVKILESSSLHVTRTLHELLEPRNTYNIIELESKGGLTKDDIASVLQGES